MNPPPSIEVIRGIENSDVDAVSFYRYEAHLTFENKNRLSFSAPFRFGKKELILKLPICEFPLLESDLIRVLGCHVSELRCDTDGTLEVTFSNGDVLVLYSNDPAYEAYSLYIEGKEYFV